MTKTENYALPQWEANDALKRGDFNEAMKSIDTALGEIAVPGFVVGSYTGNGLELSAGGLHVELGFRPRFVIISKGWYLTSSPLTTTFICTEHPNLTAVEYFTFDDTGFTVGVCSSTGSQYAKINMTNTIYDFVAFG